MANENKSVRFEDEKDVVVITSEASEVVMAEEIPAEKKAPEGNGAENDDGQEATKLSVEEELKLQAEALFNDMKASAEVTEGVEMDVLDSHDEDNIDDLAKQHYNKQLEELKEEQQAHEEEKNDEIAELRKLLAAAQVNAKTPPPPSAPHEPKKKEPLVQTVSLNGEKSRLLICDFKPSNGRIGISFKRYGSQFFVVDTLPDGQVSRYHGIGPGLLLYQVVAFTPGSEIGENVCVQQSEELARRILVEFGKGKSVQMSFLVLPEDIPVSHIQQHVLKHHSTHAQQHYSHGHHSQYNTHHNQYNTHHNHHYPPHSNHRHPRGFY